MPQKAPDNQRTTERLRRLDTDAALRRRIRPLCRLAPGGVWEDPVRGHRVGVLDAACGADVAQIMGDGRARLVIADPPYNLKLSGRRSGALGKRSLAAYLEFSRRWVEQAAVMTADDAHLYVWLGADWRDGFQPLPDFMLLMREQSGFVPRNFITLRNQRGYGTRANWMWVRQELLHYVRGRPFFQVVYTDVPKTLGGYYKDIGGRRTHNLERGLAPTLRAGNVWVDIQQVFYRLEENVPGCYAQKPLKAIRRIIESSSRPGDLVADGFAHAGTTLLAGELTGRRVYTFDLDPIFAEITIRRLERFRRTGKTGWQWHSPFPELDSSPPPPARTV
ncbi:MAG TPA: site-specific DNA-methyltransferase [Acidobacteriota bacterium]|nr:site-specific DNA-methyltransferase [Acidobacteriota bacterium]HNR38154.1 site-specific DNA-methyltransferase [Acidobacteriota bacterium]HNT99786.1 site-specific DNA-methyltransferase [Acidobacteriota bacterium]